MTAARGRSSYDASTAASVVAEEWTRLSHSARAISGFATTA